MYSIMIVDDEKIILDTLTHSIDWHAMGLYVLGTAGNGQEAVEKAGQLRPDVILTDVRMPIMNGLEMARRVKESQPEIEVVFVSGYDEFDYVKAAIALEAADYLLKPVERDELAAVMARVKRRHDARRSAAAAAGGAAAAPAAAAAAAVRIPDEAAYEGNPLNLKRAREIAAIIGECFADESFTVEDAAARLYLTPNYVRSIFKEVTGETFLECVTRLRMERAAELLPDTALKVHEVAAMVGYRNVSHFCSLFARFKGRTPNEYRKLHLS